MALKILTLSAWRPEGCCAEGEGSWACVCPLPSSGGLKASLCNKGLKTLLLRNQNRASLQLGSVHLAKINLKLHGSGSSSREGNGYPLQCSCLENSMEPDGDSPWSRKELDTTEQLTFTFQFMSPALIMRLGYAAPLNHSSVDDPRPNYPRW